MVVDLRAGCAGEDDAGDPLAAHDERLTVLAREFDQDVPVVVVLDGGGQGVVSVIRSSWSFCRAAGMRQVGQA